MNFFNETLQEKWKKDGFFVLPDSFDQAEVHKMQQWVDEIAKWDIPEPGKYINYYEMVNAEKKLSRTENFLSFHPLLKDFLMQSIIFLLAKEILGEPVLLFKEKIHYKFTGTGLYQPHQDAHGHDLSPFAFQKFHINFAIFVDDATIENGCFEVVSGYSEKILSKNQDGVILPEICETLPWEPVEVKAGSVLVFNALVPHKSNRNMTAIPRRTIYLTFNGMSKGDLREAHYQDRISKKKKTREINPDLFVELK